MSDNTGYWKENVSLLLKLLAIWFVVSFGMGIILADYLDQFQFFGFRLGFWMSQQDSIIKKILRLESLWTSLDRF